MEKSVTQRCWTCEICTLLNDFDTYQCVACEHFEKSFNNYWQKSSIVVLGASYSKGDTLFWKQQDMYYFGIGVGEQNAALTCASPWQTEDWFDKDFWTRPLPTKIQTLISSIFIDRSVWNILSTNKGCMCGFVAFTLSVLREGGRLLVPIENWKVAADGYFKDLFTKSSKPEFERPPVSGYTKEDSEAIQVLVDTGEFTIIDGVTTLNTKEGTDLRGRKSWKTFIRMRVRRK